MVVWFKSNSLYWPHINWRGGDETLFIRLYCWICCRAYLPSGNAIVPLCRWVHFPCPFSSSAHSALGNSPNLVLGLLGRCLGVGLRNLLSSPLKRGEILVRRNPIWRNWPDPRGLVSGGPHQRPALGCRMEIGSDDDRLLGKWGMGFGNSPFPSLVFQKIRTPDP